MRRKDTQVGKLVESHGTSMLYVKNYRLIPQVRRLLGVKITRDLPDIVKGYKIAPAVRKGKDV